MNDHHLRSRRDFLQGSVQSVAGLAAGSLFAQADALAAADDRFELSIHQYSLKKLIRGRSARHVRLPRIREGAIRIYKR